jgi:plastocyanin
MVLILAVVAAFALFAGAACSDSDDDSDEDNGSTEAAATEDSENGSGGGGGDVSLDIAMQDNLFEPAEFTVDEGAELTFNITNEGAAVHNMRVLGEDGEANTDDDAVGDADLVQAGATATITWTAPDEAGEYGFQCDFHLPDMVGTITVE